MKKLLAAAAALVLAATPAAAQQSPSAGAQAMPQQAAAQPGMPSIFLTREELRQKVAANEAALSGTQVMSESWWWLVTAIAVGVIIAAFVL